MRRLVVRVVFSAGTMVLGAGLAPAQDYPKKPVHIVTTETGGGSDFAPRVLGHELTRSLGQQVIIDNRGSGVIPGEIVATAAPDGYTLLVYGGTFWLGPLLRERNSYDVVRDFLPITMLVSSPNFLVVHPSVPTSSVKELIAVAKARPGVLNYASAALGSSSHLGRIVQRDGGREHRAHQLQGYRRGTQRCDRRPGAAHVPLRRRSGPHVKAGRLRALAVTSAQPSALAPDLPTVAATGLPGYEFVGKGAYLRRLTRLRLSLID